MCYSSQFLSLSWRMWAPPTCKWVKKSLTTTTWRGVNIRKYRTTWTSSLTNVIDQRIWLVSRRMFLTKFSVWPGTHGLPLNNCFSNNVHFIYYLGEHFIHYLSTTDTETEKSRRSSTTLQISTAMFFRSNMSSAVYCVHLAKVVHTHLITHKYAFLQFVEHAPTIITLRADTCHIYSVGGRQLD